MKNTASTIEFTFLELVVLIMATSHGGLREISARKGRFSRLKEPTMSPKVVRTAAKLLNSFGDWKLSGERITQLCEWARTQKAQKD